MADSTEDRSTQTAVGRSAAAEVQGDKTIFAGTLVAVKTTTGLAVPAADAADLKVIGYAEERTFGGDTVIAHRGAIGLENDATNPVTAAHIGSTCFVVDDKTVSSDGGTNSVVAGIVTSIEDGLVFVSQI